MKAPLWTLMAIGCMSLIAFLSLTPNSHTEGEKGKIKEMVDNVGHVPAYAVLCFLWINSLATTKRPMLSAVIISICFGLLMEYLQSFVPGRYPSALDACSDTLGAGIAVFIMTRRIHHHSQA